jgi:hypothetical protein
MRRPWLDLVALVHRVVTRLMCICRGLTSSAYDETQEADQWK